MTRNVEAFSEIALRLKDKIVLTQNELYSVACDITDKEFGSRQLTLLSPEQKIDLAKNWLCPVCGVGKEHFEKTP